ncbi:2-methylaconitate cis-trans isomerase PrpF [Microbacteriaceae bacterium K1510]|nr:2-methylaconitate cis-trans isomerase PrpF [Microbacteriaceae bacterium K1510]
MKSVNKQKRIPATYMRGGTSKGVFFLPEHLPAEVSRRDAVLLRVIGSPDPYQKQIDGMGGATSSTSKVVIVGKSSRPDCDVDYLFGQVAIDRPLVDWSGNCGNLSAAVGPFAISQGLVAPAPDGVAIVRIWQANLKKVIISHVPMRDGEVDELGEFELDGVTFPAAEVRLEFLNPGADDADGGAMFPTGNLMDTLNIPDVGAVNATLINAGNPLVFVSASTLGLKGTENQDQVNSDPTLLKTLETIRAHATVAMKLAPSSEWASMHRQATPKIAFVAPPTAYTASNGRFVAAADIDILIRAVSMGKLHHAMPGTAAVAIASAAALPGTILSETLGGPRDQVRFGHPSGSLTVGAQAQHSDDRWNVTKVVVSRSARRLMQGDVFIPEMIP